MLHHHPFVVLGVFVLLDLLAEAMRQTDVGLTKAAQWQDMNVGQLHRQLSGQEHLSLLRMHKLPMKTIRRFFWLGVMKFGVPPEERRAFVVQLTLRGKRRMLRLEQAAQKAEKAS